MHLTQKWTEALLSAHHSPVIRTDSTLLLLPFFAPPDSLLHQDRCPSFLTITVRVFNFFHDVIIHCATNGFILTIPVSTPSLLYLLFQLVCVWLKPATHCT